MRFVYLHGFASGPTSRKAGFFAAKLLEAGCCCEVLDLAPDFTHLTLTGQLEVVERQVGNEAAVLIGSSMGGYLAALYAVRHPNVARVLLMAPAFDFLQLWKTELGLEKLEVWRRNGTLSVFHYGLGYDVPLDYQLMEDSGRYEPFPEPRMPCLILHGLQDRVVPFELSRRFAEGRPNVRLEAFDSDHELTDVLDEIWSTSREFLLDGSTKGG